MSEIKYNEDVLDNEFEEDLVEGELSEDDIMEDDTLEGSAGFIVNSDFIPDALELKNVVETWNRRKNAVMIACIHSSIFPMACLFTLVCAPRRGRRN